VDKHGASLSLPALSNPFCEKVNKQGTSSSLTLFILSYPLWCLLTWCLLAYPILCGAFWYGAFWHVIKVMDKEKRNITYRI